MDWAERGPKRKLASKQISRIKPLKVSGKVDGRGAAHFAILHLHVVKKRGESIFCQVFHDQVEALFCRRFLDDACLWSIKFLWEHECDEDDKLSFYAFPFLSDLLHHFPSNISMQVWAEKFARQATLPHC